MTHREFMENANYEIADTIVDYRNRMSKLVSQAWEEGKKNAEIDAIREIIVKALTPEKKTWEEVLLRYGVIGDFNGTYCLVAEKLDEEAQL